MTNSKTQTYQPLEKVYVYCNTSTSISPIKRKIGRIYAFFFLSIFMTVSFSQVSQKLEKIYPQPSQKHLECPKTGHPQVFKIWEKLRDFTANLGKSGKLSPTISQNLTNTVSLHIFHPSLYLFWFFFHPRLFHVSPQF